MAAASVNHVQGIRNQFNVTATVEAAAVRLNMSTRLTTQSTRRNMESVEESFTPASDGSLLGYSAENSTTADPSGGAGGMASSSSVVGVAVGVAIAAVVLVLLFVAVIIFLLRRRRRRRRDKRIVKVENPQYKPSGNDDDEDVTLGVGLTGVAKYPSGKANGSRKRKEAPLPPIYRPSTDAADIKAWDSLTKRKAPLPPRNLNVELYEKDSPTSSTENLKSVGNTTATAASPVDDSKDLQTDALHRQPLIASSSADSKKPGWSPRKDKDSTQAAASPRRSAGADVARRSAAADADVNHEDVPTSDASTSLIDKKSSSHVSLDSYDRTKNPFFAE